MEIQENIKQKKVLYDDIVSFFDQCDDILIYWDGIQNAFDQNNMREKTEEMMQILHIINKITKNHFRDPLFFTKSKFLFSYFENPIKQNLTNSELFNFYKNNKRILLQLLDLQILQIDPSYIQKLLKENETKGLQYFFYFYPEIKSLKEEEKSSLLASIQEIITINDSSISSLNTKKENNDIIIESNQNRIFFIDDIFTEMINKNKKDEIESEHQIFIKENEEIIQNIKEMIENDDYINNDFEQNRRIGENESYICSLIRQDSVEEFISYVNRKNLSISKTKIKPSFFETNSFLINKEVKLIEYAAFFGSIQIFNYLRLSNVELEPSIWNFVIHSKNAELIHLLEEIHIHPIDRTYKQCIKESIKCHHNDIKNYIESNLYDERNDEDDVTEPDYYENFICYAFRFYNFEYLKFDVNDKVFLLYFIEYDYFDLVELFLKTKKIDINEKIILKKNFCL